MSNLCEYFGFDTSPFVDSINPAFFFQTRHHERAILRTLYCIEERRALGLIWGRSGTGKTLVARLLLKKVKDRGLEPLVILCTPGMTKTPLLREIALEMGVEKPSFRAQVLLDTIHQRVMKAYTEARRVVLFVDEAHFLASNSLHILRTLSNLETDTQKLLTTILVTEDNFVQRLKHPRYASLRGRIAVETEIPPLTYEETEQYIQFRLLVAGGQGDLFDADCYPIIHKKTGGIPREISKLADNALLETYMRGKRIVEPEIIGASLQRV